MTLGPTIFENFELIKKGLWVIFSHKILKSLQSYSTV